MQGGTRPAACRCDLSKCRCPSKNRQVRDHRDHREGTVRLRRSLALVMGLFLVLTIQGVGQSAPQGKRPTLRSEEAGLPDGFLPAAVRARQVGRYFVEMKVPSAASVALRARGTAGTSTSAPTQDAAKAAIRSQEGAIGQARSLGGQVIFRYGVLINAFSAKLSAQAARSARSADGRRIGPAGRDRAEAPDHQCAVHQGTRGLEHVWGAWRRDARRGRGHGHRLHARILRGSRNGCRIRRERPDLHRDGNLPDGEGDRRFRLRRRELRRPRRRDFERHSATRLRSTG